MRVEGKSCSTPLLELGRDILIVFAVHSQRATQLFATCRLMLVVATVGFSFPDSPAFFGIHRFDCDCAACARWGRAVDTSAVPRAGRCSFGRQDVLIGYEHLVRAVGLFANSGCAVMVEVYFLGEMLSSLLSRPSVHSSLPPSPPLFGFLQDSLCMSPPTASVT